MRIGELAERTGASVRSLRYYEQRGLLRSHRTVGNQREFEDSAIERVRLIRDLLAAGLSTETIEDVLPCMSTPANQTPRLTRTLLAERRRLDAEIASLEATRDLLDDVIAQAPPDVEPAAPHST